MDHARCTASSGVRHGSSRRIRWSMCRTASTSRWVGQVMRRVAVSPDARWPSQSVYGSSMCQMRARRLPSKRGQYSVQNRTVRGSLDNRRSPAWKILPGQIFPKRKNYSLVVWWRCEADQPSNDFPPVTDQAPASWLSVRAERARHGCAGHGQGKSPTVRPRKAFVHTNGGHRRPPFPVSRVPSLSMCRSDGTQLDPR